MNSRFRVGLLSLAAFVCMGIPVGVLGYLAKYYKFSARSVVVVYADVGRFEAVVQGLPEDESLWPAFLAAHYLDPGSQALRSYERATQLSGAALADLIARNPSGWTSCRFRDRVRASSGQIHNGLARFEELYPAAIFPRIYFVVGSGSVTEIETLTGVVVPAEVFTGDDSSCTLRSPQTLSSARIPCQVVHELVHFNQRLRSPFAFSSANNLDRAIQEGSADFVAELAVGCHTNPLAHSWGGAREGRLWLEFQRILDIDESGDWFDEEPEGDRPKNLGAFIGYSIVESYYLRAADKQAAIEAIVSLTDSRRILEESDYRPRPR